MGRRFQDVYMTGRKLGEGSFGAQGPAQPNPFLFEACQGGLWVYTGVVGV